MNSQRILIAAGITAAAAGIAFLAFHPRGKKIARKATDIGLEAADKIIDLLRTTLPGNEEESKSNGTGKSFRQMKTEVAADN
jgi:hypothetical protein